MPLTSPRFRNEPELLSVAVNRSALRRGARGRHVHLVQMALLDLGFAMPVSTRSDHFSPDGIYGAETERVVSDFQGSTPGLSVDGTVGHETLLALDRRHPDFTHRINLHFRSLSLTDVPFDRMLSSTERAYAQYGIQALFMSGASLGLSQEDQDRFNVIDQDCDWDLDSGEFAELHNRGPRFPLTDVGVFIVNRFQDANTLGCGGHSADRPACTVTHDCSRWDVAHEVCHVMLTSSFSPVHTNDRRNLMFPTSSNGATPLTLTEKQLAQVRANPLCHRI
jgi:hypothetical protein